VAHCNYYKLGNGKIITEQSICYLLANDVNAKFYLFTWFWLIGVAAISAPMLIYRFLILLLPELRVSLLMCLTKNIPKSIVTDICQKINRGDWFFLYLLGKNLDKLVFDNFLYELHHALDIKKIV
jgi:hypothetical protein